jgi:hypothetical protein
MPPQHRRYFDAYAGVTLNFPGSIIDAVLKRECCLGKAKHGQNFPASGAAASAMKRAGVPPSLPGIDNYPLIKFRARCLMRRGMTRKKA